MVAKRAQCFFKNWSLKDQWFLEVLVYLDVREEIWTWASVHKTWIPTDFQICCSTGQLWKFIAVSWKMELVRDCFGFNYCSHCYICESPNAVDGRPVFWFLSSWWKINRSEDLAKSRTVQLGRDLERSCGPKGRSEERRRERVCS